MLYEIGHGYGVYRFYTGDSYVGQWFSRQSHGIEFGIGIGVELRQVTLVF